MDKEMCEHNTSVVIYAGADTTVEICEWGCDRILVHKILPSGTSQLVREVEHPQLAALREEVGRLRASNSRIFDDLHNQIHQTVGAEMERDELREQVADVNELLWEFTEYPNIELGEKGHSKIEDYFKKYSQNKG